MRLRALDIGAAAGARAQGEVIAVRIEREPIGGRAARRRGIAKRFLDMRQMPMQRAEHGLRHARIRQHDHVHEFAAVAHVIAIAGRVARNEFCAALTMLTSTMSPARARVSSKWTDC